MNTALYNNSISGECAATSARWGVLLADGGPAGQAVRLLLPWTIGISLGLTGLVLLGHWQGFYAGEVIAPLFVSMHLALISGLICWTGKWLLKSDLKRRKEEADLRRRASCDPLTGLVNRREFLDRLNRRIEIAKRDDSAPGFAVLYIDLDEFKSVNDRLGHNIGDCLLAEVAQAISGTVRQCDVASRIGGDEFTILLEEISSPADAEIVASRIIQMLSKWISVRNHAIYLSLSIGIAVYHAHHDTPEAILTDADAALYQAKTLGKGRHAVANCRDGTVWLDC